MLGLCKAVLGLHQGCEAKIPHILLYKEAFCLPFVSSDHPIIPSPHILGTGQQLLKHLFSAGYSILYFLIILISEIYIYISTSLTFTYKRKTKRITHQVLGSTPPGYNFLNSGLIQLGYFNIYSTHSFLYFINQLKGSEFNS